MRKVTLPSLSRFRVKMLFDENPQSHFPQPNLASALFPLQLNVTVFDNKRDGADVGRKSWAS